MNHSEVLENKAVERYLLDEMEEEEAESFELHFFECPACAEELALGAAFRENLRAIDAPQADPAPPPVRETPTAERRVLAWWRRPWFALPAFATAALAFAVVYQAGEIASLRQPQTMVAYMLKSGRPRGPEGTRIAAGRKNTEIRVDVPDLAAPKYRCELYDASGRQYFSMEVEAPAAGDPLSIGIPKGLPEGSYTLKVNGVGDSATGREFKFEFEAIRQ